MPAKCANKGLKYVTIRSCQKIFMSLE